MLDAPILLDKEIFVDDRGWSIPNMMFPICGQINFSVIDKGVIKAWHRHEYQNDAWICLRGKLLVGVCNELSKTAIVYKKYILSGMKPQVLHIPAGYWHGCRAIGDEPAELLYHVDKLYDSNNPDEIRAPFDTIPDFWRVEYK